MPDMSSSSSAVPSWSLVDDSSPPKPDNAECTATTSPLASSTVTAESAASVLRREAPTRPEPMMAGTTRCTGLWSGCPARLAGLASRDKTGDVRKQYHFWPGERRFDAWDVDRLIALSSGLPVKEVALDSIREVDTDYWFKIGPVEPTVRQIVDQMRLVQEVDLSYPIILGVDGQLMDGMHRVARAILDGHTTIKAVQFTEQPQPDYRDCSPHELPY